MRVSIACPHCIQGRLTITAKQREDGLGYETPKDRVCKHCRAQLVFRILPFGESFTVTCWAQKPPLDNPAEDGVE